MKTSCPKSLNFLAHACLFHGVLALIALFAQNGWAAGGYAGAVQADGPIAYWRFNDTPPTAANAGSLGAAANGTYNGGATAGAQAPRPPAFVGFEASNTALQCDGTAAFMGTAISLMNGRNVWTISGWMRRNGTQASRTGMWGQNDIVEFGYIDNSTVELWTDNGLHTCSAAPNTTSCDPPDGPVPNGEWAHYAVVSDGSPGTAYLYTNGVLANSRSHSMPGPNAFFFNIGGGGVFDGTGNFFNGQIDEVAVFDKALTAQQIAAQYAAARIPIAFTFDNCQLPPGTALFSGTDAGPDAVPNTPANQRGYIGDDGTGTNCVVHLTDPINSSYGTFRIPDQASGNNVDHLKVQWRSLIGGSSAADGYSFSWATDLPAAPTYGNPGEEGAGTGLTVAVDTFENGSILDPWGDGGNNGGNEAGIEIHWKGAIVAYQFVNQATIRKNTFVDVEVEVDTSGLARFNYDGNVITAQLAGWSGIAGGNYMFGARTGGANDRHWIDNIQFTVFPPSKPFITQQPADQTLRQGLNATFSATVVGSPPLDFQWLRKLTTDADFAPIAGANAASYTTPALVYPDDDNSQYKLRVSNVQGMAESRAALLHVLSDTNPPTILSSAGSGDFLHATLVFSEELDSMSAEDEFNYSIDGNLMVIGARVSDDRKSVTLTTDMAQAPDTLYTVTVNGVKDLAGLFIAQDSTTSYRTWRADPCNGVLFESYLGIGGNTVADLTGHPNFPNNPSDVALIARLDSRLVYADDSHEGYGGRMRGVFFPRESGLHTFYLAADDNAELWLSTDLSPANKVRIARETQWSNTKEWTSSAGASDVNAKHSAPIALIGGQPYYIEALWKEGGGGDHCSVAVQTPSDAAQMPPKVPMNGADDIPADMLGSPNAPAGFAGAITIATPPTDQTAVQCRSATFSVVATSNPNGLPMCHQWQLNGADIPGANHASYTTPPTLLSDDGGLYTVNITMAGGASASASARLHVTADTTPPDCPTAAGVSALNQAVLTFNEVLDPTSAEDEANYSIAGVTISSAVLDGSKTKVTLTVSPLLPAGATVSVAVHGVKDCSGNAVASCSASFQTWQLRVGSARREFYLGIGGVNVNDLRNNAKYPNSPDQVTSAEMLEGPIDNQMQDGGSIIDNYGERVSGFLLPPVTGAYNFWISSDDFAEFWLSTDADPGTKVLVCREPEWNGIRNWTGAARRPAPAANASTTLFPAGIILNAGQMYYFEALGKEGGGGDNLSVTWQTPAGGPSPGVPVNSDGVDGAGSGGNGNGGTKAIRGRYLSTLVPPGSDTSPPTIVSCKQLAPRSRLIVTFSEIMRAADAESLANYSVSGASLTGATLRPDQRSVELTAAADIPTGGTLTVNNLKDGVGNSIAANTTVPIQTVGAFLATTPQNLIVFEAEHLADVEAQAGLQPWSAQNSAVAINRPDYWGNIGVTAVHPIGPGFSGDGFAEVILDGFRRFHGNTPNLFNGFGARGDYLANFPVAGTYYIWVRGSTFDGSFNSFHMGLDGVSEGDSVQRLGNRINNWGGNATGWGWHNDAQNNPARITVASAGLHTVNIWPREDGTRIDKIVLTTDAAFTIPRDDPGPAESPQNDCPVAVSASVSVMQDSSLSGQLPASDADGDALQYQVTAPPSHGTVVVQAATGAATYTPAAGYCGPDSFKFRVTDGQCNSQEATISITVVCLNRCPTARITTIALCTAIETNVFISPNGSNACFVLDGSLSSDPDGDTLTYSWFADGVPIGAGVRSTNCLDLGEHTITLVVDDGRCTATASVSVDVLTGGEAVEALITKVNDASLARANKRPLIATLKASLASFDRGSFHSALGQLGAFINKVRAQIEPDNPDEAALFTRCAQSIIDSVECEEAGGP